jgi:ribosome recycling factor
MYKQIIDKSRPDLDKTLDFLKEELMKVRAGRANPSLVEDIKIEVYGEKMAIKQVANVIASDARQLLIQPWDHSYLQLIERAISTSDLGINPIIDKNSIRISLPPLSDEYRKQLMKLVATKEEAARNTIRHFREKIQTEIQDAFKRGEVSEDDKFKSKDDLQKLVDEYSNKIKVLGENKIEEIKL